MNDDKKERQAGYVKTYYDKRKAKGDVKTNVWLTPAAAQALDDAMKKNKKTKEETINQALLELAKQ